MCITVLHTYMYTLAYLVTEEFRGKGHLDSVSCHMDAGNTIQILCKGNECSFYVCLFVVFVVIVVFQDRVPLRSFGACPGASSCRPGWP